MRFKDLPTGAIFEFDRTDLHPHIAASMIRGPWVKTGRYTYQPEGGGHEHTVGTTLVKVLTDPVMAFDIDLDIKRNPHPPDPGDNRYHRENPVSIRRLPSGKFRVRTPGGVKAYGTTYQKSHAQRRILEQAEASNPIGLDRFNEIYRHIKANAITHGKIDFIKAVDPYYFEVLYKDGHCETFLLRFLENDDPAEAVVVLNELAKTLAARLPTAKVLVPRLSTHARMEIGD